MSSSNRPVTTAVPPKSAESAPPPQWSSREYAWPVSARQATSTSETAPGVDAFLLSNVGHPRYAADPAFEHAKQRATDAGLPAIAVSALFGQYLAITAKAMKAERIIEIGTLGGYSTGFLANALPSHGTIDTIEISPEHAKIAQRNFLDMDLFPFPTTHVGPALDVLRRPEFEEGAYDLIFVDADKAGLPEYLIESLRLLRPGGLGVFDNTVRAGR